MCTKAPSLSWSATAPLFSLVVINFGTNLSTGFSFVGYSFPKTLFTNNTNKIFTAKIGTRAPMPIVCDTCFEGIANFGFNMGVHYP